MKFWLYHSLRGSFFLFQEVGWFDRVENSPGILTARLATEVSALETVTGLQLGILMEAISLTVACLAIGFVYSWELPLVNLCFTPVLVIASALQVFGTLGIILSRPFFCKTWFYDAWDN